MVLRPAQQAILKYHGGRMAVSAVPGSGKTFTLSMLASKLIRDGRVNTEAGQQVLVVTYLNSSVETFRVRIRQRLEEHDLPQIGYEVRTLHSLALEIVRLSSAGTQGLDEGPTVVDEPQALNLLARAVDGWIDANRELWHALLPDNKPQQLVRWRDLVESTAKAFIREAKNHRYPPAAILQQLSTLMSDEPAGDIANSATGQVGLAQSDPQLWFVLVLAGIYERYQSILDRQGVLDFDDLIWRAAELLASLEHAAVEFRSRWPFVLEDEAQDSVPLQETLLGALTGPGGNWVRVGDPNQAITSTFTSAHPRHFNAFMRLPDVLTLPLPNSGRCAPRIYNIANLLVNWVSDNHPVPEVRANAFRRQEILPTPPGDIQPNPPDSESDFRIKVFRHREDEELPTVAQLAVDYAQGHSHHTVAVLAPTNDVGHKIAGHLDALDAPYDDLLRGGTRVREIASAFHWLVRVMANPLDSRALEGAYATLVDLEHPVVHSDSEPDHERIRVLLRSVHLPEFLLYGADDEEMGAALPAGIVVDREMPLIFRFARFIRHIFQFRPLAIDDMMLSLGDVIFAAEHGSAQHVHEADRAIAFQLATTVRRWWDLQPDWRLPELAAQLADVAEGRRRLHLTGSGVAGYSPEPGRITLATQHGAKGMEWDAVFLLGIDSRWIPGDLDGHFLGVEAMFGGDPAAEVNAQLHYIMKGEDGLYPGRTATESAHIEVISERLRLLYVGITRARRYLHVSRSRQASHRQKDFATKPATVMGVLYHYLKENAA